MRQAGNEASTYTSLAHNMTTENNAVTAETAAAPAVTAEAPKAEAKPLSEKAATRKANEKALRAQTVDYKAKGVTIKVLAKTSPKKAGSKAREIWDLYVDGLTVEDLLKAAETTKAGKSYAQACIVWDVRHGHIALEAPAATPVVPAPNANPASGDETAHIRAEQA